MRARGARALARRGAVSTVGYGDIVPTMSFPWSEFVLVVYIVVGLILCFPKLAGSVSWLTRPFANLTRSIIDRRFPEKVIDIVRACAETPRRLRCPLVPAARARR